jgi:hypothetical protein
MRAARRAEDSKRLKMGKGRLNGRDLRDLEELVVSEKERGEEFYQRPTRQLTAASPIEKSARQGERMEECNSATEMPDREILGRSSKVPPAASLGKTRLTRRYLRENTFDYVRFFDAGELGVEAADGVGELSVVDTEKAE